MAILRNWHHPALLRSLATKEKQAWCRAYYCKKQVRLQPRCNADTNPDKERPDMDEEWLSYSNQEREKPQAVSGRRRSTTPGPRFTQWGGAVRGGKYKMGEGADKILSIWGNADFLLFGALAVLSLFCVLLNFIPPAPK